MKLCKVEVEVEVEAAGASSVFSLAGTIEC